MQFRKLDAALKFVDVVTSRCRKTRDRIPNSTPDPNPQLQQISHILGALQGVDILVLGKMKLLSHLLQISIHRGLDTYKRGSGYTNYRILKISSPRIVLVIVEAPIFGKSGRGRRLRGERLAYNGRCCELLVCVPFKIKVLR